MSKITVQVSDSISVAPDTIVMCLNVNYKGKQHKTCFDSGVDYCHKVLEVLSKYTNRVEIGNKYVYEDKKRVETKKGNKITSYYRRNGFIFNTLITAKFSSGFDMLDNLVKDLEEFNEYCSVNFSYCLEDTEKYKDELLSHLVELARVKADILAKASNLTIVGVDSIQYNKSNYNTTVYGMRCVDMNNNTQSILGTETAKPVQLSDSVVVIYKTKG